MLSGGVSFLRWAVVLASFLGSVGAVWAVQYERSYPELATYYEIGTSDYAHVDSLGVELAAAELDSVVVFVAGTGVPGEEFCEDLSTIRSTIVWWVVFHDMEADYVELASELIAWDSEEFALTGTYYPDPEDSAFNSYLQSDSALVGVALYTTINPGCWSTGPTTNATITNVTFTFYGDINVGIQSMSWDAVKSLYR